MDAPSHPSSPTGPTTPPATATASTSQLFRPLRRGDHGPGVTQVADLLSRLGLLETDAVGQGEFDDRLDRAVRAFQQQRGLFVDGIVGPSTFRRLDEARWRLGDRILTHRPGALMAGDDVYALQSRLLALGFKVGRVDGFFGAATEAGVREFQRNVGLPADGTCGPATLKALGQLSPIVSGGAPNAMRSQERIREAGPHLGGKIVVLDPTLAPHLPARLRESAEEVVHDLARRVEGRLVATGVQAFLTTPRWAGSHRDETQRAAFANRSGADLSLSLGVDASANPDASGLATYFFGSENHGTWSSSGERFAGLVQREVTARADLVDLRSHAKTWDFLRRTRMPAVKVDLGYLTNAHDRAQLTDATVRDVVAEALVVAVQRFYLSPEADSDTGLMRLSELRASLAE